MGNIAEMKTGEGKTLTAVLAAYLNALPVGPVWWLFWLGVGIVVLGAIIGAAVRIFDDWY